MPKAKGDEEQKIAAEVMVAEDNAAQSDDKAAKKKPAKAATEKISGAKAAVKKPSKAASDDAESVAPRPRPVVSARPSIYEDITAAAKKLDAERAAKAVNRASTVSQNAKKEQMSSATATPKKAASPFLATNIARAAPSILKPATEAAKPITPSAAPASIAPLFPTTQAQPVNEESLTPSPTAAAPTPPTAQPKTAVV